MIVVKIQTQQPVQDVATMAETLKVVEAASPKEVAQAEQAIAEAQQPPLVPNKILMNLCAIMNITCISIAIIEPEVKAVKTETEKTAMAVPVVDRKGPVKKKIPSTIRPLVFSKRRVKVSYKIQIVSKWRLS